MLLMTVKKPLHVSDDDDDDDDDDDGEDCTVEVKAGAIPCDSSCGTLSTSACLLL